MSEPETPEPTHFDMETMHALCDEFSLAIGEAMAPITARFANRPDTCPGCVARAVTGSLMGIVGKYLAISMRTADAPEEVFSGAIALLVSATNEAQQRANATTGAALKDMPVTARVV